MRVLQRRRLGLLLQNRVLAQAASASIAWQNCIQVSFTSGNIITNAGMRKLGSKCRAVGTAARTFWAA